MDRAGALQPVDPKKRRRTGARRAGGRARWTGSPLPLLLCLTLSLCCSVRRACAHGGPWVVEAIHFFPGSQRMLLQSALRGFASQAPDDALEKDANSPSWRWTCMEALGESSLDAFRGQLRPLPSGGVMAVGVRGGVQARDAQLCAFPQTSGLEEALVRDVIITADQVHVVGTETLDNVTADRLYMSADGGETFMRTGVTLPQGFSTSSARALGQRWLAVGDCDRTLCAAYSDDQGQSWERGAALPLSTANLWRAVLPALPPNAAVIPVMLDVFEPEVQQQPSGDTLYISRDQGASLEPVFQPGSALYGLALSPDGATLAVNTEDGLYIASLELLDNMKPTFERTTTQPMRAMRWTDDGLYVGIDEFLAGLDYSVGRSTDGGKTFEKVMSICDLQQAPCPQDSIAGIRCPPLYSDNGENGGGFVEDFSNSPHCQQLRGPSTAVTATDPTQDADAGMAEEEAATTLPGPKTGLPMTMYGDGGASDPVAVDSNPPQMTSSRASAGGCSCGVANRSPANPSGTLPGFAALSLLTWLRLCRRRTRR